MNLHRSSRLVSVDFFRISLNKGLVFTNPWLQTLNEVPVRQTGNLPQASFRFPVARVILAFIKPFLLSGCVRGSHPVVIVHSGRT